MKCNEVAKLKKIIGVTALCLLLIIGGLSIYVYSTQPIAVYDTKEFEVDGYPAMDQLLTKKEVKEDIDQMIEIMESTHPIFLEKVPKNYYSLKDELLRSSHTSMTTGELQKRTSAYVSSIDDGHTFIRWHEQQFLDVHWKYSGGNLVLLDQNNQQTNRIVTKIGNVEMNCIINVIEDTFPAENDVATSKNIEKYSKENFFLESAGVEFGRDMTVTVQNQGVEEILQVEFINEAQNHHSDDRIYSHKIDPHTAYIRLGICEVNPALEKVLQEIEKYRGENTTHFIIDVMDNPGGDSGASAMILEALNVRTGDYGSVIRFSPLAQEQRGYVRKSGQITFESRNKAVGNDDIQLYVLTNERTFSSAQMLAVWVSDGKLGTIVGRPSSNKPSSFGDILNFQLKNSKIVGQISHKKWTRPDMTKNNENELEPDIYVEDDEDILEKALEKIKNETQTL
jgi:hypothetical protein